MAVPRVIPPRGSLGPGPTAPSLIYRHPLGLVRVLEPGFLGEDHVRPFHGQGSSPTTPSCGIGARDAVRAQ